MRAIGGVVQLFSVEAGTPMAPDGPAVATPIGRLRLSASAGCDWTSGAPCASFHLADDARLLAWETPLLRAEMLFVRPRLTLPPGLAVIDCRAAVWRVRAA